MTVVWCILQQGYNDTYSVNKETVKPIREYWRLKKQNNQVDESLSIPWQDM